MNLREFFAWLIAIVLGLGAMNNRCMNASGDQGVAKPRYLWPWIVAALVIIGLVIAVISVRREALRIREQRQLQMPNSTP